ncbi:uncharacterized protein LOC126660969 [Mercurialis annua]|uniref:uncharacterized protein LOC126660969 n=1 Tax=Mercurialis annua TaxID=3986 RepID=UPI00215F4DD7|nr:uncharacterized protein LOC126660969 [Mercurialis annua]
MNFRVINLNDDFQTLSHKLNTSVHAEIEFLTTDLLHFRNLSRVQKNELNVLVKGKYDQRRLMNIRQLSSPERRALEYGDSIFLERPVVLGLPAGNRQDGILLVLDFSDDDEQDENPAIIPIPGGDEKDEMPAGGDEKDEMPAGGDEKDELTEVLAVPGGDEKDELTEVLAKDEMPAGGDEKDELTEFLAVPGGDEIDEMAEVLGIPGGDEIDKLAVVMDQAQSEGTLLNQPIETMAQYAARIGVENQKFDGDVWDSFTNSF